MKDFTHFGVKRRIFPKHNYDALWINLKTTRFDHTPGDKVNPAKELPAGKSEFYDVSLGTVCTTGKCPFCYVSSNPQGYFYEKICETWKKWMSTFYEIQNKRIILTDKPFQVAIGE